MYNVDAFLGRGLQLDNNELREESCPLGLDSVAVMEVISDPHCPCITLAISRALQV